MGLIACSKCYYIIVTLPFVVNMWWCVCDLKVRSFNKNEIVFITESWTVASLRVFFILQMTVSRYEFKPELFLISSLKCWALQTHIYIYISSFHSSLRYFPLLITSGLAANNHNAKNSPFLLLIMNQCNISKVVCIKMIEFIKIYTIGINNSTIRIKMTILYELYIFPLYCFYMS